MKPPRFTIPLRCRVSPPTKREIDWLPESLRQQIVATLRQSLSSADLPDDFANDVRETLEMVESVRGTK
jgi:hypothetical protein